MADQTVADDALLRQCSIMVQDIRQMKEEVLTLWREGISVLLPDFADNEDSDEVQGKLLALHCVCTIGLSVSSCLGHRSVIFD